MIYYCHRFVSIQTGIFAEIYLWFNIAIGLFLSLIGIFHGTSVLIPSCLEYWSSYLAYQL